MSTQRPARPSFGAARRRPTRPSRRRRSPASTRRRLPGRPARGVRLRGARMAASRRPSAVRVEAGRPKARFPKARGLTAGRSAARRPAARRRKIALFRPIRFGIRRPRPWRAVMQRCAVGRLRRGRFRQRRIARR
ncbi:hypothetical protein ACT79_08630 [Burkholderia pseudomallei]|nr:hypothetical protein ACT79_08630 [Burkholderia pseudomallei]